MSETFVGETFVGETLLSGTFRVAERATKTMNNPAENTELIFTIFMMAVLLVLAIIAVVVFLRIWRKENKGRDRNFFE
ncbi:MAG: hypothetical protein QOH51_2714 [Acidobacteriota bacterium]|nr:hypothetical protein [Acidobacteriota bacterium]